MITTLLLRSKITSVEDPDSAGLQRKKNLLKRFNFILLVIFVLLIVFILSLIKEELIQGGVKKEWFIISDIFEIIAFPIIMLTFSLTDEKISYIKNVFRGEHIELTSDITDIME